MSRWKFGEEISHKRSVDGRPKKGHVALGLAAGRNEDELSVADALLMDCALVGRLSDSGVLVRAETHRRQNGNR